MNHDMTDVLQALISARRSLRDADDAAGSSASLALANLLDAAISAVDVAIYEANLQQAQAAVTVPSAAVC